MFYEFLQVLIFLISFSHRRICKTLKEWKSFAFFAVVFFCIWYEFCMEKFCLSHIFLERYFKSESRYYHFENFSCVTCIYCMQVMSAITIFWELIVIQQ